jgi:hypothetical protein
VREFARWALLPALFIINPVLADGEAADAEAPSLEMLEYLGEWEQDNEQWIDPESFYESDMTEPTPADYRPEEKGRP